jgi:hypothetical protein|tara:strand:- start:764 stop:1063 length:300 start_codon:yes stop_codon:yes gene_type:complete
MMTISLVFVSLVDWAHESHEFAGNDPVHISVFDSLVNLVFFHVEGFEFVPVEFNSVLKALQHLQQRAFIGAISFGSVSISFEQMVVWLEHGVSLLSRAS